MVLKNGQFKLKDSVYNILKWVCLVVLPALSSFYSLLASIWGLPYEVQIPRTITAIALLIGALIGISQVTINKETSQSQKAGDNSVQIQVNKEDK